MISFRQYLTELFDKPYPYQKDSATSTAHATGYKFNTGDSEYGVVIFVAPTFVTKFNKQEWMAEVSFGKKKEGLGYELMPTGTDSKNALRIYATVAYIIRQSVKIDSRIKVIYFTAAHAKTLPLYRRFAKQIAKEMGGTYEFKSPDAYMVYL